ncbi:hypothetical protein [Paraglaciecola aestuariivivens]
MPDELEQAFTLMANKTRYQVLDKHQTIWLDSSDANTAKHYLDLFNKAYAAGFKQGFKSGRNKS